MLKRLLLSLSLAGSIAAGAPASPRRSAGLVERRRREGRIVAFVTAVTDGGKDHVRPPTHRGIRQRRNAVVRAADVLPARVRDRPRQGAGAEAPEWKSTQPFKAALEGDVKALAAAGEHGSSN